jgi:hypothetical protein
MRAVRMLRPSGISKTVVKFRSQILFANVVAEFPSLQGHLKSWEGEGVFARDYNSIVIFVGERGDAERGRRSVPLLTATSIAAFQRKNRPSKDLFAK